MSAYFPFERRPSKKKIRAALNFYAPCVSKADMTRIPKKWKAKSNEPSYKLRVRFRSDNPLDK